jgi:hypothetical protein
MAVLSKGHTFATGDSPTATQVNNLVDAATFATGAVDNSTTSLSGGAIIVKDGGVTPAKLSTGHPTWTAGGALSATSLEGTPIGATTAADATVDDLTVNIITNQRGVFFTGSVTTVPVNGALNFNVIAQTTLWYTDIDGDWVPNIRGDVSNTLNSLLGTNASLEVKMYMSQDSTAAYPTDFKIDGSSQTVKWEGGVAPSAGATNTVHLYVYHIIKTASATYTVTGRRIAFA